MVRSDASRLIVRLSKVYPVLLFLVLLVVGLDLVATVPQRQSIEDFSESSVTIVPYGQLQKAFQVEDFSISGTRIFRITWDSVHQLGTIDPGGLEYRPFFTVELESSGWSDAMRLDGVAQGPGNLTWKSPRSNATVITFNVVLPPPDGPDEMLPSGKYLVTITNLEPKQVTATLKVLAGWTQNSERNIWPGALILVIALVYPALALLDEREGNESE